MTAHDGPLCPGCAARDARIARMISTIENIRISGVPAVKEQLQHPASPMKHAEIIAKVCRLFFISLDDIYGPRRTALISRARFAACWMLQRSLHWSSPRIARAMKLKNHTSVLHALRRVAELRTTDSEYRSITDQLIEEAA